MKIVQTFWTGNADPQSAFVELKAGWKSAEFHWMSWCLSCFQLKKQFGEVHLVTDRLGKQILIDWLKLPYSTVSLELEAMELIHPKLFSLAKIKTYSLQKEPFLHIDGDLFLFRQLTPDLLKMPLISSNPELDLEFNRKILQETGRAGFWLPDHLKGIENEAHIYSSNAGVIGGNDLDLIAEYADCAFHFVEKNKELLNEVETGNLNFLFEQVSLFYLAKARGVPTAYVSPEPVTDPMYHDFISFADVPEVPMVHAMGNCKRSDFLLRHLARRFRLYYPESYYKIIQKTQGQGGKTYHGFYNRFGVDHIERGDAHLVAKHTKDFEVEVTKNFARTLTVLRHAIGNVSVRDIAALEAILEKDETPEQCRDIIQADKGVAAAMTDLNKADQLLPNYLEEKGRYERVVGQFGEQPNLDLPLKIRKTVRLIKTKWNWQRPNDDESMSIAISENFGQPPAEYLVSIVPDALTLNAWTYFLDPLDGVIVEALQKHPMTLNELYHHLSDLFDEPIDVENNREYRTLILDIVKRLLFDNTLEV